MPIAGLVERVKDLMKENHIRAGINQETHLYSGRSVHDHTITVAHAPEQTAAKMRIMSKIAAKINQEINLARNNPEESRTGSHHSMYAELIASYPEIRVVPSHGIHEDSQGNHVHRSGVGVILEAEDKLSRNDWREARRIHRNFTRPANHR